MANRNSVTKAGKAKAARAKFDTTALSARITAEYRKLGEILRASITLPERHVWAGERLELTWAGDVVGSTEGGASHFIQLADSDFYDPGQYHCEVRYFFAGGDDTPPKLRLSRDRLSATIWCMYGQRIAGKNRDLIQGRDSFVYADTVEGLAVEAAARINAAIQAHQATASDTALAA